MTPYQMVEVLRECVRDKPQAVAIADRLCSALITIREAQVPGDAPTLAAPATWPTDPEVFLRVIAEAFADFDIGGWWKCVPGPERRQLADTVIAACDAYRRAAVTKPTESAT